MRDIEKDTFKILSDYIFKVTGERPFLLEENFTRPSGPYIGCKLLSCNKISQYAHRMPPTDDTGVERFAVEMILRWHIQAYRDMAVEKLASLTYRLNDRLVRSILSNGGLGYRDHTPVTQTTVSKDGVTREKQAVTVFEFHYVYEDDTIIGEHPLTIEKAGVEWKS